MFQNTVIKALYCLPSAFSFLTSLFLLLKVQYCYLDQIINTSKQQNCGVYWPFYLPQVVELPPSRVGAVGIIFAGFPI